MGHHSSLGSRGVIYSIYDAIAITKLELAIDIFIGLMLIFIERILWLFKYHIYSPQDLQNFNEIFNKFFDNPKIANVMTFIQWFALGVILYLLVWAMLVVIINGYNDIVISEIFVHPKSFNKSHFWLSEISRFAVRISALVLLVLTVIFSIKYALPAVFNISRSAFQDGNIGSILKLMLVPLITILCIHIGVVLMRFILLKRRLIYMGEA